VGDVGEGKGETQDIEQVTEELGDTLPGLLPPHQASLCVSVIRGTDAALTVENGEPLFEVEVEYEDK
jgi:hypothetical protein